jgi:hypothetical protein
MHSSSTFGLECAHRIRGVSTEDARPVGGDEAALPERLLDVRDGLALGSQLK